MFKTERAYKLILGKYFGVFIFLYFCLILSSSLFVFRISQEIQDSLLTIMSIIFPLIAGFLTFGREMLISLKNKIKNIKDNDEKDRGRPTTDSNKIKIQSLKSLSYNFISVVTSSFMISFILIISLLVSKFNDYLFITDHKLEFSILYFTENWINISIKIVFFYLSYSMLLNLLFLSIFIVKTTNYDESVET